MDDKQLKYITEHLENVITKTVNGKIDKLDKKFDKMFIEHREKMDPIYEAYTSANNTGTFIVWLSKIILAIGIIIGAIIAILKW